MALKELLGDAYKETMTAAEIEELLKDRRLIDEASGKYIPKEKFLESEKQRKELEKKVKDYEDSNLSDKEKGAQREAEMQQTIEELKAQINRSEVEGILKGAGLDSKDYEGFIDSFIGADLELSKTRANAFVAAYKKNVETVQKNAEKDVTARLVSKGVKLPDTGKEDKSAALGAEIAKSNVVPKVDGIKDIYK